MNSHRKTHPVSAVLAALLLLMTPLSFAASDAIPAMARIVAELNHYPSAEQKAALAAISKDDTNSVATRTIANAIHNIEHKAKPDDVAALKEVAASDAASEAEKTLATIIIDINHTASGEAKKALEALAK